jgi:hypothetical protein
MDTKKEAWEPLKIYFINRRTWTRTRDEEVEAPSDNPLHHTPIIMLRGAFKLLF